MVAPKTPVKRGRSVKTVQPESVIPKPEVLAVPSNAEILEPETVLIHFTDDFVALGVNWQAGQELEVTRGSAEFLRTCDLNGNSWMDTTEETQLAEGGKVCFKKGPSDIPNPITNYTQHVNERIDFYGVSNATGSYLSLAAKQAAAEKEIARGRGVPKREW
jgi:hypothetical protein